MNYRKMSASLITRRLPIFPVNERHLSRSHLVAVDSRLLALSPGILAFDGHVLANQNFVPN